MGLKGHLKNKMEVAKQVLQNALPTNNDEAENELSVLQRTIDGLQKIHVRMTNALDQWMNVVSDIPDEQRFFDEGAGPIQSLLFETDDLITDLTVRQTTINKFISKQAAAAAIPAPSRKDANPTRAAKPPKFALPTFSGDYIEFKQFWGIFDKCIHSRTDLNNVEKFTYLINQLRGDAKTAIAGIPITDEGYEAAVEHLQDRFDKADDRIVTLLYSQFMCIRESGNTIKEKQRTFDDCEKIFRQLETAGEEINSNKALVNGLLTKFPLQMIQEIQRFYKVTARDSLEEVREGINVYHSEEEGNAGIMGDLQAMKKPGSKPLHQPQHQYPPEGGDQYGGPTMPNIGTGAPWQPGQQPHQFGRAYRGPQMIVPPSSCYFCGGHHFNSECREYPSAKKREDRLRKLNRCILCLRLHRSDGPCTGRIRCIHCRVNTHASVLCHARFPDNLPPPPTGGQDMTNGGQNNANQGATSGGASDTGFTGLNHSNVKPVFFQTAKTTIVNHVTGKQQVVRLAMDTLSSRSYIREKIADNLGLTGAKDDKLFISVFGMNRTVEVPTSLVEFDVTLRNGYRTRMAANTTKIICRAGALPEKYTDRERSALQKVAPYLADDPFDAKGTIDVLIGSNLVWEFIQGSRMQTEAPDLFFIPSLFGLMLSGTSEAESDDREPSLLCITESASSHSIDSVWSCVLRNSSRFTNI